MALDANSSCRNDLETRELCEFSRFSLVNRDAGALLPFASRGLRFDSSRLRGRGCFYSHDAIEHPQRLRRKIKNKGDGRGRDRLRKLRRTCQQLPSRVSSMFHPRDSRARPVGASERDAEFASSCQESRATKETAPLDSGV